MRKLLEKLFQALEKHLYDEIPRSELEARIYDLKERNEMLLDSVHYYQDVIDGNESLRNY